MLYALCIFQSSLSRSLTWLTEHSPISWYLITAGTTDRCLQFVKTRLLRRLYTYLLIISHWISSSVISTQKLTSFGYTSIYFCCLFVSLITSVCNLKVARQTLHHSLPRTVLQLRVTRSWPTSLSVETNSTPHLALFPPNSGSRRTWFWLEKV